MTRLFYNIFPLKQNNAKIEKLSKKRNKHETKKVFFPSHCENKKIITKSLYNMIDYFLQYIYNSDNSDSSDHYYRCQSGCCCYHIIIIIFIIIIIIIIITIVTIELTHSKTILENTVEIEPQSVALDFKNLSQYSSRSK